MTLKNATVSEVRRLTDEECDNIGIPRDNIANPYALILEYGSILFPASDRAMNHGGGWGGDTKNMESLTGDKITDVAPMSQEYMEYIGFDNNVSERPAVLSFSNDKQIYTTGDSEGNGSGILFEYLNDQTFEISFEVR